MNIKCCWAGVLFWLSGFTFPLQFILLLHSVRPIFWPLCTLIIPIPCLSFLLSSLFCTHLSSAPKPYLWWKAESKHSQRNLIFLWTPSTYYLCLFLALRTCDISMPNFFIPSSHPLLSSQCPKASPKCCLYLKPSWLSFLPQKKSLFSWTLMNSRLDFPFFWYFLCILNFSQEVVNSMTIWPSVFDFQSLKCFVPSWAQ